MSSPSPLSLGRLFALGRRAPAVLVYMTDTDRDPDPLATINRLPPGAVVILRDYGHPSRAELGRTLARAARGRRLVFLVAGDAQLARRLNADGLHMPEWALKGRTLRGQPVVSAACHSRVATVRAGRCGVRLKLVSPVFDTGSSGGKTGMGVHRAARMIAGTPGCVALGGITRYSARRLRRCGFAGLAGISGLID